MKKFSGAAVAAVSLLISSLPANAGLGAAAVSESESGYDAWCGKRGNDCKVVFKDEKITVDGKDSVKFQDLTYITRSIEHRYDFQGGDIITFGIEYKEEGMSSPEFAQILFMHYGTADRFWLDLKRACRQCKDRDATQVEVDVKLED